MKKFVLLTGLSVIIPMTVSAMEFPAYSAIDNVRFDDPSVKCEDLHNEDDCLIWRDLHGFKSGMTASGEKKDFAGKDILKQVRASNPAAGRAK